MRRLFTILLCCFGALAANADAANRHIPEARAAANAPISAAVVAGNFIYVTGTVGTDASGQLGADIGAQTGQALDNMAATLKKAGATLADVVATQVFLTDPANATGMNEAYGARFSKNPPARVLLVTPSLAGGKALIEINAIAVRRGVSHRAILPRGWQKPSEPFSYGQKVGNTLFVSALAPRTPTDESAPLGNIGMQTKTAMDNIGAVLQAAGMDFSDVAAARVWISDMRYFQNVNAVYRSFYVRDFPARATLQFRFVDPAELVQISAVAVRGGPRHAVAAAINADGSQATPNPNYSAGMRVGDHMWVTGMTGATADNKSDVASQTRETLASMLRVLKAAGFTPAQVVDVNVYLQDLRDPNQYQQMNAGYREVFRTSPPARTTVQAANAGKTLVEIVMQAAR